MSYNTNSTSTSNVIRYPEAVLKGFGQIMLQNNAWTGLFFLAGISLGSLTMGIGALIAVITGTLTAMLLGYDREEINSGLYGFSAALVGVALTCFFQLNLMMWIAVITGSVLAAMIQHLYLRMKVSGFTFPFILVTWLILGLVYYYPSFVSPATAAAPNLDTDRHLGLFAHSFGQVIFQAHPWSGILFMVGILFSRPVGLMFALVSIILSGSLAYLLKEPITSIYAGLFGYNAVLCALAFAGKKLENIVLAFLAVTLSVIIMIQMRHLNIPALTFPFVLASWLTMLAKPRFNASKARNY